jgi:hypothetical protein
MVMKTDNRRTRIREYWKNLMHSTHRKMSEGAECIARMIRSAHSGQWRRKDKVQHRTDHHSHNKK